MRFATASGAVYDILDVDGEQIITRDCDIPIRELYSGEPMESLHGSRVFFDRPPTIGERFHYVTASHGGCVSTAVVSIETTDTEASN